MVNLVWRGDDMEKTVLVLLAIVIVAAAIAPTGALYQSNVEIGPGSVISEPVQTPTDYDATVDFIITKVVNKWYYEFIIIIKNISDEPLSDWKLEFNYDGDINWIWNCTYNPDGIHNTCTPINIWQTNYTIPVDGYTVLQGHGREMGTEIWDVTVNDAPVPYSYYHDYTLSDIVPQPELTPEPSQEGMTEEAAEPSHEAATEPPAEPEPVPETAPETSPEPEPEPTSEPEPEPTPEPELEETPVPESGQESESIPGPATEWESEQK